MVAIEKLLLFLWMSPHGVHATKIGRVQINTIEYFQMLCSIDKLISYPVTFCAPLSHVIKATHQTSAAIGQIYVSTSYIGHRLLAGPASGRAPTLAYCTQMLQTLGRSASPIIRRASCRGICTRTYLCTGAISCATCMDAISWGGRPVLRTPLEFLLVQVHSIKYKHVRILSNTRPAQGEGRCLVPYICKVNSYNYRLNATALVAAVAVGPEFPQSGPFLAVP